MESVPQLPMTSALYLSPKQLLGQQTKQVLSLTARLYNPSKAHDQRGKW